MLGFGVTAVKEPSCSGGGSSEGAFMVVVTGIGVGSRVATAARDGLGSGENEKERGIEL